MKSGTLERLGANELYVAVSDADVKRLNGYALEPGALNASVLHAIFEPSNETPDVLVFYANANTQRLVHRDSVKIYNVETGKFRLAWAAASTGTETV